MSRSTTTRKTRKPVPAPQPAGAPAKGAAASRLHAQTRKQLGKHYRAKYGVR
jgi:hypothetical protein